MSNIYHTKERFGYDTPDNGSQDISRVTTTGKIGLVADATSCSGWDCTIAGQFCPKGVPGASSSSYVCGVPRSELGEWGVGDGLRWIAAESRGGRPSYTDINPNPFTNGVPNPQGLPTHKWWVGSAAPYYDYPECHIPYNQPCNYGSALESEGLVDGDCCFGASSCVADIDISGGDICEPHRNKWNFAHDRRGADKDGCTLQPGSQCDYGTTGCCKDYRAWGGSNHRCEYTNRGADGEDNPKGQASGEYYNICVEGSPLTKKVAVAHGGDVSISNSDIRLKENVELIGKSPSNINIYKFNYIGDSTVYEGVIANELPWLSVKDANGYLTIDYNQIDVEFKKHIKL